MKIGTGSGRPRQGYRYRKGIVEDAPVLVGRKKVEINEIFCRPKRNYQVRFDKMTWPRKDQSSVVDPDPHGSGTFDWIHPELVFQIRIQQKKGADIKM